MFFESAQPMRTCNCATHLTSQPRRSWVRGCAGEKMIRYLEHPVAAGKPQPIPTPRTAFNGSILHLAQEANPPVTVCAIRHDNLPYRA